MSPPPPAVRLGFVGCGNVLSAYLSSLERLRRQGLAEATVFCGRERQRVQTQAAWPGADFLTDYERLLAREDVDVVVILTPMAEHAAMARAALTAGRHVLVEKPLATNLADAQALIQLAKRSGRYLVCAPFTVLSPTFQTIGHRLQRGDIGRVVSARGRYGWAGPDWTEWFYRPGGALCLTWGFISSLL
ncbi:MAG: Gfo/Idh/MocA family oxidoreductase [Verrucomicrobiota bacterium]